MIKSNKYPTYRINQKLLVKGYQAPAISHQAQTNNEQQKKTMEIFQTEFKLPSYSRGYHIITKHIEEACSSILPKIESGILHVFIHHTSASLTINENADPSVRTDFRSYFDRLAPEKEPYYTHTMEGPDDMPAHLKASSICFVIM